MEKDDHIDDDSINYNHIEDEDDDSIEFNCIEDEKDDDPLNCVSLKMNMMIVLVAPY
ncbi:hypothetical protein E5676_scaffold451G001440 [Cucumis melo var. makuwa]|uniref:Uncharacterized protein n=1 Tax=Cucumis melo var. makuwa TaxID=1194695 RepID=A0A5D3BTM0_CUCMM|nr:hypothetical protein E5676_scaffold451G001440 [Cucumis melo var. makuwa]